MSKWLVEVRERGSGVPIASISDIIEVSITKKLSEIGNWQFSISAFHHNKDYLVHGREVLIFREGNSEPEEVGIIQNLSYSNDDDGTTLVVSGSSLALELTFLNTYRGMIFRNVDIISVFERILSGTGWTGSIQAITDTAIKELSRRVDNMTIWSALKDMSEVYGAHLRETFSPRIVEIFTQHDPTGIVLTNLENVGSELGNNVGVISALRKYDNDSTNLYNRIVPIGKIDGHDVFDLSQSTRTSPYTIKVLTADAPEPTSYERDDTLRSDELAEVGKEGHTLELEIIGIDRLVISGFFTNGSSGAGNSVPASTYYNSVRASSLSPGYGFTWTPFSDLRLAVRGWKYAQPGTMSMGWSYSSGTELFFMAFAICFQNAARDLAARDIVENSGTSANPFTEVVTEETDMVIDFLMYDSSTTTATPALGQEEILTGNPGSSTAKISVKRGQAGTTSMAWGLSASRDWLHAVMVIRGSPNYYIEDEASINQYGLRAKPVVLGEYKLINLQQIPEASNTLYDKGSSYLTEHKDPVKSYEFEVGYMPNIPFLVGNTMLVQINGFVDTVDGRSVYLNIDEDLIVIERTLQSREDSDSWNITVSDKAAARRTQAELLTQAYIRLDEIQNSQV